MEAGISGSGSQTGIEYGVEQVDQKIDNYKHQPDYQYATHDHGQIEEIERFYQLLTQSIPTEYVLDEDLE